jgi:hypothetical protein
VRALSDRTVEGPAAETTGPSPVLHSPVLLYAVLLYAVLLYAVLLYAVLLHAVLLHAALLHAVWLGQQPGALADQRAQDVLQDAVVAVVVRFAGSVDPQHGIQLDDGPVSLGRPDVQRLWCAPLVEGSHP